jgi:2-polyprenyl-6-methoxyphenol hydroxylase-like FAD-dependent oxidoreductase
VRAETEAEPRRAFGPDLDQEAEVLVVGAGPVGLYTALVLAEHGVRARILDEGNRPAARSYALVLHPATLALFDRLGLAQDLVALGHRLEGLAFYEGMERQARVSFAQLPGPYPFALVLPQQALEGVLEGRLRESGIEVEWNHRLARLRLAYGEMSAGIERLARGPDGRTAVEAKSWVYPDWVIGADGSRSVVRQALGVEYAEVGPAETYAVFEISADLPAENEVRVVLDESTAGVLWPIARDRFRWSFRIDDWEGFIEPREKRRRFLRVSEEPFPYLVVERLRELLDRHAPWFTAEIGRVVWSAASRFECRLASRFGRGNVWLAGDAAHLASPIGVQSMNVGLREAHDLATRLVAVLQREASDAVFDSYAGERQSEWRQLLGLAGPPSVRPDARPWVRTHAARLPSCLPATGDDLAALLEQLGLEPPAPDPA